MCRQWDRNGERMPRGAAAFLIALALLGALLAADGLIGWLLDRLGFVALP